MNSLQLNFRTCVILDPRQNKINEQRDFFSFFGRGKRVAWKPNIIGKIQIVSECWGADILT